MYVRACVCISVCVRVSLCLCLSPCCDLHTCQLVSKILDLVTPSWPVEQSVHWQVPGGCYLVHQTPAHMWFLSKDTDMAASPSHHSVLCVCTFEAGQVPEVVFRPMATLLSAPPGLGKIADSTVVLDLLTLKALFKGSWGCVIENWLSL